jgi:hypothetical protein
MGFRDGGPSYTRPGWEAALNAGLAVARPSRMGSEAGYIEGSRIRYLVGDTPTMRLNTRLKWVKDWKPTS